MAPHDRTTADKNPVDFLRQRRLLPHVAEGVAPERRTLLAAARPLMPIDIGKTLTGTWTERSATRRLGLVHALAEMVLKRICEIANAAHAGRYREAEHPEDACFLAIERLLSGVGPNPKLSFGTYLAHLRAIAPEFRKVEAVPEIGEIQSASVDAARAFQVAIDAASMARKSLYISDIRGVEHFVTDQVGKIDKKAKSLFVLDAFTCFIQNRNAAAHDHEWWSNDEAGAELLYRYAMPALEALLASDPVLGLLVRYEVVEVATTSLALEEVGPVQRVSVRPEWVPLEPSRLRARRAMTFLEPLQLGRRDNVDPCLLWYVGPSVSYPSPVKDQQRLFEQYRDIVLQSVWTTGGTRREALNAYQNKFNIARAAEAEKQAWTLLLDALAPGESFPSPESATAIQRALNPTSAAPITRGEIAESERRAAWERIRARVLDTVVQFPGTLRSITDQSSVDERFVQRMLDELVQGGQVLSKVAGKVTLFVPPVPKATETFSQTCTWLARGYESGAAQPFGTDELLGHLVRILEEARKLLFEAGQMNAELTEAFDTVKHRHDLHVETHWRADAGAAEASVVAAQDSAGASGEDDPSITIGDRTFVVRSSVRFFREFHAAFGAPGSAFQRALDEGPILAGRTRFLASRGKVHKNDNPFKYELPCGEEGGPESTYFWETHIPVQQSLFALANFLRDRLHWSVSLGSGAGAGRSSPTTVEAVTVGGVTVGGATVGGATVDAESATPFTVYLAKDGLERTVEGRGVKGLLESFVRGLLSEKWLAEERLPVPASRTRYLVNEAPYHQEGEFKQSLQVEGYYVETQWTESEVLGALRVAAAHLGIECSTDEDDAESEKDAEDAEGTTKYWKIAPDRGGAGWDDWLRDECATVGWPGLGDLSECMTEGDFEQKAKTSNKKDGIWQVWAFRKEIVPGDVIIANEGTRRVLGIGRVVEGYSYDPAKVVAGDIGHPHVIKVRWEDVEPREVNEQGWRRTLVRLKKAQFESILAAPKRARLEPELQELAAMPCSKAREADLVDYLREVFCLQHRHGLSRRLNETHGMTRLSTLFAKEFDEWPTRDVAWARRFKAATFLQQQKIGLQVEEVRERLDAAAPEVLLGVLFPRKGGRPRAVEMHGDATGAGHGVPEEPVVAEPVVAGVAASASADADTFAEAAIPSEG